MVEEANPDMNNLYAGDVFRIKNPSGGRDWWYVINEIQMGGEGCESIAIITGLSRKASQWTQSPHHQVPLPILERCEGLAVIPEVSAFWRSLGDSES